VPRHRFHGPQLAAAAGSKLPAIKRRQAAALQMVSPSQNRDQIDLERCAPGKLRDTDRHPLQHLSRSLHRRIHGRGGQV